MKIAYLSVFYPYRGGISQFNGALYRALEKGNEVRAFNFTRQYPSIFFPGKTQYVDANDTADNIFNVRLLDSINPFTYYKCAREILKFKPDLLFIQFWMPFFAPSLGWVARIVRKRKIPVISLLANVTPHEAKPADKLLTKFFLEQSDAFVVLADAVKHDLLKIKPDAKVIYHPHPNYEHFGKKCDMSDARMRLNIPADKKVLLFFGLIRKYKGLDILLETMKDLPEDYFLIIAGEVYGDNDYYERIIKRNNLEHRIQFHNKYLKDDELTDYFSAADVCVLPYKTATQSGIVGVSYNFELPVISTDVGGLKEVIKPYNNGIVIDKADTGLLRDAIIKYFSGNMKQQFITNINNSKKYFSWGNLASEIEKLFHNI